MVHPTCGLCSTRCLIHHAFLERDIRPFLPVLVAQMIGALVLDWAPPLSLNSCAPFLYSIHGRNPSDNDAAQHESLERSFVAVRLAACPSTLVSILPSFGVGVWRGCHEALLAVVHMAIAVTGRREQVGVETQFEACFLTARPVLTALSFVAVDCR
jgi:hypothetical protein